MRELIKVWRNGKFSLRLYDTNTRDEMGKYRLAYKFKCAGVLIFEGADFSASPMHAIDSLETVASLLGFLSLRKGDTDDDYFRNYTPAQLEFSDAHGEELSLIVMLMEERLEKRRKLARA